jgi:hypothetical protein
MHDQGLSTETVDWAQLLDGPLPGLVAAGQIDEARRVMRSALLNNNGAWRTPGDR